MAYGTIKVDTIENTNGQTGNAIGPGFKNRIINGAMVIDQRNAGAAVTVTDAYTLDRWKFTEDTDGAASVQQVSDAPTGFNNSSKVTVTTADATIGAAQFTLFWQPIEGFNWADLGYGAAGAKTSTLSFWVKSSLTGTFSGALENSAGDRSYIFSYTISAANTWEQKTVTITGDTTGTWIGATNGTGVKVFFTLTAGTNFQGTPGSWGTTRFGATGTTQLMSTLNATWQITGVQLEVGPSATSFDYRPYGTELALCQRYFQRTSFDTGDYTFSSGYAYANNTIAGYLPLAVPMRATPTAAILVNMGIRGGGLASQTLSSLGGISYSNGIGSGITVLCNPTTTGTSLTSATVYVLCNQGSGGFTLSAEL